MSSQKIFLLGPPRIELDGVPVEIRHRKGLALLAYLAVTGEAQLRDTLATLLWPESSQREARAALRNELWLLKEALGETWLDLSREAVALYRGPDLWLDVEQFQQR